MKKNSTKGWSRRLVGLVCTLSLVFATGEAEAVEFTGTVTFDGTVSFASPIAGIDLSDVVVGPTEGTEGTEGGEKCTLSGPVSDQADGAGNYPSGGSVQADLSIDKGGPQAPTGSCVVSLQASATDGAATSARGSATVFVSAAEIDTSASVSIDDIVLRELAAVAGLDKDCFKWAKKQLKFRAKCNDFLLSRGPDAALKCKDAGPRPDGCDPGGHVEAITADSYGDNDQQTDPPSAELVDRTALKSQLKCQKLIGKSVLKYATGRAKLVDKRCVLEGIDSQDCRDAQGNQAKRKLDGIAKCIGDQTADGVTGRLVPAVGSVCGACIDAGVLDTKCLRSCFQTSAGALADGLVGDIAECGNGIVQPGEFCDDGNTTPGDCCDASCVAEPAGEQSCGVGACEVTVAQCSVGEPVTCVPGAPGTEGPGGDPSCTDGIDNDCDGTLDGGDDDCN